MEFVNKAIEKGKAEAQPVVITPEARVPVLYGGDEIIMCQEIAAPEYRRWRPSRQLGPPFRATIVYIKNQRAKVMKVLNNGLNGPAVFYDIDLPSDLIVGVPCMGARRLDLMVRCPRPTTTAVTTVDGRHLCAECGTVDAIYAAHIKDIREYLEGPAPEGYSAF